MADDAGNDDDGRKWMFLSEEWKVILDQLKVPRKKRTPVEFFDCNCVDEPKMEKKPKRTTKNVTTAAANGEDPVAEMPLAMREHIREMGGYGLQLVIEKVLTATDLRTDQGRLALPPKQLRGDFLTAEEEKFLVHRPNAEGECENGLNYIDATIVGPDLAESTIRFKKWRIGAKYANCLMNKWNCFAKENRLKAGNNIQLWTFRVDRVDAATETTNSELCFALVKL